MDDQVRKIKDSNAYMEAATERIQSAQKLLFQDRIVLAIYVSGVAVECVFRAFHAQHSREFSKRHDLLQWSIKSGLEQRMNPEVVTAEQRKMARTYRTALNELSRLWLNSHRYRSERDLRRLYEEMGILNAKGGVPLMRIAEQAYGAAQQLYDFGIREWKRRGG
jgi:hypothetical protein